MSIRKKLRLRAETELQSMIEQLEAHALQICGDSPVEPKELCRLVIGGRMQTVLNKVIGKMADKMEEEIVRDLTPAEEQY